MEVIWIDGGNYLTEFPKYGFDMSEVEVVNLPKTEKNPYIVGVNGVVFAIAAGEDINVPLPVFNLIQKEIDEKKKDITPAITTEDNFVVHINAVVEYGDLVSASCDASPEDLLPVFENGFFCGVVIHYNEVKVGGERIQYTKKFAPTCTESSTFIMQEDGTLWFPDTVFYDPETKEWHYCYVTLGQDRSVDIEME